MLLIFLYLIQFFYVFQLKVRNKPAGAVTGLLRSDTYAYDASNVHLVSSTEQVRTREDNIVMFIPTIGYQELSPEQLLAIVDDLRETINQYYMPEDCKTDICASNDQVERESNEKLPREDEEFFLPNSSFDNSCPEPVVATKRHKQNVNPSGKITNDYLSYILVINKLLLSFYNNSAERFDDEIYGIHLNEVEETASSFENIGTLENISEQPNDYAAFFEDETYPFYANEVEDMAPSFENIGTWENISENPHDVTNGIGLLLSNKYRPIKLDVPWTDFLLQWSRLFVSSSLEYSQGK